MKPSTLFALLLCATLAAAQTQPTAPAADAPGPAHLTQEAAAALVEKRVPAAYPDKARRRGVEGTVEVEVLISETGEVKEASAVSGDPDLAQAAINSIKQWKYKPYTLNGNPQEVETLVSVKFQ